MPISVAVKMKTKIKEKDTNNKVFTLMMNGYTGRTLCQCVCVLGGWGVKSGLNGCKGFWRHYGPEPLHYSSSTVLVSPFLPFPTILLSNLCITYHFTYSYCLQVNVLSLSHQILSLRCPYSMSPSPKSYITFQPKRGLNFSFQYGLYFSFYL